MADEGVRMWVVEQEPTSPGSVSSQSSRSTPKSGGLRALAGMLGQSLGFGLDAPVVATDDFYHLTAQHISGDVVSFEKFRGKVTLVMNVASK